jgi:multidrug efflux pump subunit AcrA (membrane-fusion protein)
MAFTEKLRLFRHRSTLLAAMFLLLPGCRHTSQESAGKETAEDTQATVSVAAVPIEKRRIDHTIAVLGRCEAPPQKQAFVTSIVEGQVAELLAKQGDQVTAGQPLVQLDTQLVDADLAEKQTARDSALASLRLLQASPRSQDRQIAELAVDQANVAVQRAEAQLERLKVLRDRNEIPEAQTFEAEESLKQVQLQQQTAQAQLDLLLLPPRAEAIAEAQSKVAIADKAVETAKTRLALHSIKAPIAGTLDSLTCRPGQTISVGTVIGDIVDNDQIIVAAWVPVDKSQSIRVGQSARVRPNAKALSAATNDKPDPDAEGSVSFVGLSTDPQTGNVPLQISVSNRLGNLVVGQTLIADIDTSSSAPALCVPRAAVHDEGDSPAITVIRDQKAVVLHPELGERDNDWIAISGVDLNEGELVATSGAYNLPDGTPVKVQEREAKSPVPPKPASE